MSARTPFFPTAVQGPPRPSSRALTANNDNDSALSKPKFLADPSSSLHAIGEHQNIISQKQSAGPPTLVGDINPTRTDSELLPISGLLSKKKPQTTMQEQRQNIVDHSDDNRSNTADPHSNLNQPEKAGFRRTMLNRDNSFSSRVFSPIPIQARWTSDSDNANMPFKMPILPGKVTPEERSETNSNADATTTLDFSSFKPQVGMKIRGQADSDKENTQLLQANSNFSGPQRVMIDSEGSISARGRTLVELAPGRRPNSFGPAQIAKGRRMSLKRPRSRIDDADEDHADSHEGPYKRLRTEQNEELYDDLGFQRIKELPDPLLRISGPTNLSYHPDHRSTSTPAPRESHAYPNTPSASLNTSQYTFQPQGSHEAAAERVPGALDKLLDRDTDAYIEAHMDKYDSAAAKWIECTLDEWTAGAEELVVKYNKLMQFVQAHVSAKIKLFSNFDATFRAHNETLEEREKILATARDRLIKESGSVLG